MAETSHLLLSRVGQHAQQALIERYREGRFGVFDLNAQHASRLAELMHKYADLPMDLADASLVILAEHLRHGQILSIDERDFRTYRWKNHEPFVNLLTRQQDRVLVLPRSFVPREQMCRASVVQEERRQRTREALKAPV